VAKPTPTLKLENKSYAERLVTTVLFIYVRHYWWYTFYASALKALSHKMNYKEVNGVWQQASAK